MNLGTSQRDEMTPLGNTNIPSIRAGNMMVARSGLLMLNWLIPQNPEPKIHKMFLERWYNSG